VVSAHSDTVFPESTELKVRQLADKVSGPGIGDNSLGVAGLFGLLWSLNHVRDNTNVFGDRVVGAASLPGDLWLVANVGEEGLGDLAGMRAVVDRFAGYPLAYIVLEGMALGQIYHRALAVRRFRITARTKGGHSWVDYGNPSAIHSLSAFINRLTGLDLPKFPRTTLNVGVISGGTSVNTIAAQACLELDLRSEELPKLEELVSHVEELVRAFNRPMMQFDIELIGHRPSGQIPQGHPLVRLAQRSLKSLGIQPCLNIGSTDANIPLSQGYPAVCLGLTSGGGAHTVDEYINIRPLRQGLRQLVLVVEGAFQELPGTS
jgi:di/tripeptidase